MAMAMRRPLVTVVVPVYNHVDYLEECLASVVAQTERDWELVVVDDGSTQGDIAMIVEGVRDPRIRLLRHVRNRGLAAARNTGMRLAGGEHLLALDADDRLEPTFLAETLRTMRGDGAHNAVFTDFLAFGVRSGRIPFQVRDVRTLLKEQWIPGSGTLFRRSLWDSTGGFCEDEALRPGNEDWDFWLSAAECGLRAARVAQPLYWYRQHPDSMVLRLQYHDSRTREFIYRRHQALFDRYRMRRVFLGGGYLVSAKAHWRRHERLRAIGLSLYSFWLAPVDCVSSLAQQSVRRLCRRYTAQHSEEPA